MMTRKRALLLIAIVLFSLFVGFFIYGKYKISRIKKTNIGSMRELIEEISELVIPSTETPGAKDAKVADYIINVMEHCVETRDRNIIINGLIDLEEYSIKRFSVPFKFCTSENKNAVLHHFDNKGVSSNVLFNKIRRRVLGEPFFKQMKWLIVSGYCTSKLGATKGLAYDHIPINYTSCIPYTSNQRSWATN